MRWHVEAFLWAALCMYQAQSVLHRAPPPNISQKVVDAGGVVDASGEVDITNSTNPSPLPKVYVYDLEHEHFLMRYPECAKSMFAAGIVIPRWIRHNPEILTVDPDEADFFYVPIYNDCIFDAESAPGPNLRKGAALLQDSVRYLEANSKYWNNRPQDHIFTFTHDLGPCLAYLDCDDALRLDVVSAVGNAITLQTFAVTEDHPCFKPATAIAIPPYIEILDSNKTAAFKMHEDEGGRKYRVSFVGTTDWDTPFTQMQGVKYANGMRVQVGEIYGNGSHSENEFYFSSAHHNKSEFLDLMSDSIFCLCIRGFAPWSPRIIESMQTGCIPVIIADELRAPFSNLVDWRDISVRVPEDLVLAGGLLDYLAAYTHEDIALKRQKIRESLPKFLWTDEGGATDQVMMSLQNIKESRQFNKEVELAGTPLSTSFKTKMTNFQGSFQKKNRKIVRAYRRFDDHIELQRPQCTGQRNLCLDNHIAPEVFLLGAEHSMSDPVSAYLNRSMAVHTGWGFTGGEARRSRQKEAHVFDSWQPSRGLYTKGKTAWLQHYPECATAGGRAVYFDATPNYLTVRSQNNSMDLDSVAWNTSPPVLMKDFYGDLRHKLKFIVLMRRPIERMQSAHFHGAVKGDCDDTITFVVYMKRWLDTEVEPLYDCNVVAPSLYAAQLARWIYVGYDASQFIAAPMGLFIGEKLIDLGRYMWDLLGVRYGWTGKLKADLLKHPTPHISIDKALSSELQGRIDNTGTRIIRQNLERFVPDLDIDNSTNSMASITAQLLSKGFKLFGYEGKEGFAPDITEWLEKAWNSEQEQLR